MSWTAFHYKNFDRHDDFRTVLEEESQSTILLTVPLVIHNIVRVFRMSEYFMWFETQSK